MKDSPALIPYMSVGSSLWIVISAFQVCRESLVKFSGLADKELAIVSPHFAQLCAEEPRAKPTRLSPRGS